MLGVRLDRVGRIGRVLGGGGGLAGGAQVAGLRAVLQQAKAVAGVLRSPIAIEVAKFWVERAGDQVVDMLGMALDAPYIAGRLRIGDELGVAQQLVGL